MKNAIALTIMLLSLNTHACNQVIKAVYGPFFSVSFYQEILSDFHANIEKISDCKIAIKVEPTHEKFIMALVKGEADMSLIPGFYYDALQPYGLRAVYETKVEFSNILIANKKIMSSPDISQLRGKSIMVQGVYSRGYFMLQHWLAKSGLSGQVNIDYGHRHDVIGIRLLKKQGVAGVISTAIFNRLPQKLKDQYITVKKSSSLKSLLIISERSPVALKPLIENSIQHMTFGEWGTVTNTKEYPQRIEDFRQQLSALIKSQDGLILKPPKISL